MGVPRLAPYIFNSFPKAVEYFLQGKKKFKVDYLYLDANGMLHESAQVVFHYGNNKRKFDRYNRLSEKEKQDKVYEMFFDKIREVTGSVTPTKVLYIAIDGPAPLAKQAQQRQRRFVASAERLNENADVTKTVETTKSKPRIFDSNQITPGTIFMYRLSRYMEYAIRKEMNNFPDWRNLDVIFSPPSVPGEGEHKILDYIRVLPEKEREEAEHCLFGPDGDLLMLTLSCHIPKMFLFRADQYHHGHYHFIDMGMIRLQLAEKLGQQRGFKKGKRNLNDIADDFVLEGFFVGNDFLPKIQMFSMLEDGLEFMLRTYKKTSEQGMKNFLTVNNRFNFEGFTKFIEQFATYEVDYLIDQRDKHSAESKFRNQTLVKHITERIIKSNVTRELDFKNYRIDYYSKAGIAKVELKEGVKRMCHDYIKSTIWVFDYYVHGLPAWRWAYEWHYAPLMSDLVKYLRDLTDEEKDSLTKFKLQQASLPFVQLLSVLPPASAGLLPRHHRKLMLNENSPLVRRGYYPEEFDIDYEGKFKDYQGIALLSFVDYDVIYKYYNKMTQAYRERHGKEFIRNDRGNVKRFKYDATSKKSSYTSEVGNIYNLRVVCQDEN